MKGAVNAKKERVPQYAEREKRLSAACANMALLRLKCPIVNKRVG